MSKSKTPDKKWIIVKHASKDYWMYYFDKDPSKGVDKSYSAHITHSGKEIGILPVYTDKEFAQIHCDVLNNNNPSGGYVVCPLNYSKTSIKH